MKNIAAFFDVDGTIFRNSLLIEHFKLLIKNKYIPKEVWTNSVKDSFDKWSTRNGDYDKYLEDLVEKYMECIKDISLNDANKIAKKVIELHSDKLYKFTRSRIDFHKNMRHKLIIISGSPSFLVKKLAKKLGFDDYIASDYEVVNGYFTGFNTPMWDSESKRKAVNYFEKKYDIDLNISYAYGDTSGDYTMLTMVGYPYAINPAKKLLNRINNDEVLKNKIEYIVERKDVIYSFNSNNLRYFKEEIIHDTNK